MAAGPEAARDRAPVRFHERLTPGWLGWFAAAGVGASFGFVVLPLAGGIGYLAGFLAGAVPGALVGLAVMAAMSAMVEVTTRELRAGRASISLDGIGPVEVLDRAEMAHLRGRGIDPRSYHCQRGWLAQGVRVEITDPADPTPYWLISSRHPGELAAAIKLARGAAGAP
jgi:hypothetical protein